MSMLCVPRHGSWFSLLVCHAQGALPVRYQQRYMFLSLIWLSFHIVQVMLYIDISIPGGVGYFSNKRGFSVESSLQHISSKKLLWKLNDSSVVLYSRS